MLPSTLFIIYTVIVLLISLRMYLIIQNNQEEVSTKIQKINYLGTSLSVIGGILSVCFFIIFVSSYIDKLKPYTSVIIGFLGGSQVLIAYFVSSILLSIVGGMIIGTNTTIYPTVGGMSNMEQQLLELTRYTYILSWLGFVCLGFFAGQKSPFQIK